MAKILLVEDDSNFAANVRDCLQAENHAVEIVGDGAEALSCLLVYTYDVVILDVKLPGSDGMTVCRDFRARGGKTPILMLTGQDTIEEKVTGMDSGADDYLTKPCNHRELAARVRGLLRRSVQLTDSWLKVGNLTLDNVAWTVTKSNKPITLRPMEFKLLEFFLRHPRQVFSADAMLGRVWNSDSNATVETIKAHIARLRNKIDAVGQPSLIRTIPGVGYVFEPQDDS